MLQFRLRAFTLIGMLLTAGPLSVVFAGSLLSKDWRLNSSDPVEQLSQQQDTVCPLANFYDADLHEQLMALVESDPEYKRLVNANKMSIGVVDIMDVDNPRFASVNGDVMMYAASLPKIAVLLAAEDAIEKNEVLYTDQLEQDMRQMISKSNNQATTRIIDLLGYEKIESVVRDQRYLFYDPTEGGGLWVGKRYAAGGPTNREPIKNLSHAATADQVCRFYYLLINHRLVSPERSDHMLEMLECPEIDHKFVHSMRLIDPNARLFRKSGTWQDWHADSIMVISEERQYILVALIQDSAGERIIQDLAFSLDRIITQKQD